MWDFRFRKICDTNRSGSSILTELIICLYPRLTIPLDECVKLVTVILMYEGRRVNLCKVVFVLVNCVLTKIQMASLLN